MSVRVMHWVWGAQEAFPHGGNLLLMLSAIADEADDDGFLAQQGIPHLARKVRVHRITAVHLIEQLETLSQLLVRRPARRGRGNINQYVVLMGRNPTDVSASRGWSRPADAGPVPPGAVPEPVDNRPDPGPETTQKGPRETLRSATFSGPEMVAEWLPNGSAGATCPSIPQPQKSLQAARAPARPRGPAPVDDLTRLARLLARRPGLDAVRWDLPARTRGELLARLAGWPSSDDGITAMARAAEAAVAHAGPPRSARAWVDGWLALVPPADRGVCVEHGEPAVNNAGECPACRADRIAAV